MRERKDKKKRGLDFTFFRTIFAIVIAIDIGLTFILWGFFSGTQIPSARDQFVMQLEQVCTSVDILYSSLEAVSNQILADADTYASLAAEKVDRLQEHKSCLRLKYLKSANPYIRYAGFYNAYTDRYLSNSCVGSGEDIRVQELYDRLGNSKYTSVMRTIGNAYPFALMRTTNVYTFVFGIQLYGGGPTNLIILDVDASYFNDVLANIALPDVYQQVAFLDGHDTVIAKRIAAKGETRFQTAAPALDFDISRLHTDASSGSFGYRAETGVYNFTSFAKAPKANWTVVNVIPYKSLISVILWASILTVLLFLVTLVVGYLLSRRASRVLYAPIHELYVNFVSTDSHERKGNELDLLSDAFSDMYARADKLEQGLISSYTQSKNLYLIYLLEGDVRHVTDSAAIYKRLEINLNSPYYGLLMIECTQTAPDEEDSPDARLFIFHYALENITTELTGQYCRSEFLRLKEDTFVALLYLDTPELPAGFAEDLETIPRVIEKEFQMQASVCLAGVADAWQNVNMIYEQARIAMANRTIDRNGQVFFSVEKADRIRADHYYNRLDLKFAEYARAGDMESCEKEFDNAIAKMENISFKTARSYFHHIMLSVLDGFSYSFEKNNDNFQAMISLVEEIDGTINVQGIRSACLAFLSLLITQLNYNRANGNTIAAEKAKEYIDKNYTNPDLSLKLLADIVNLSAPYLGKVFTAHTSYSFTDYLSLVRITKAAELLENTRQSVSAISEAVGILNTNYFYSLFKKQYSMTPSEYRKRSRDAR